MLNFRVNFGKWIHSINQVVNPKLPPLSVVIRVRVRGSHEFFSTPRSWETLTHTPTSWIATPTLFKYIGAKAFRNTLFSQNDFQLVMFWTSTPLATLKQPNHELTTQPSYCLLRSMPPNYTFITIFIHLRLSLISN